MISNGEKYTVANLGPRRVQKSSPNFHEKRHLLKSEKLPELDELEHQHFFPR